MEKYNETQKTKKRKKISQKFELQFVHSECNEETVVKEF